MRIFLFANRLVVFSVTRRSPFPRETTAREGLSDQIGHETPVNEKGCLMDQAAFMVSVRAWRTAVGSLFSRTATSLTKRS